MVCQGRWPTLTGLFQLFSGWMILHAATLSLSLVPKSALLWGFEPSGWIGLTNDSSLFLVPGEATDSTFVFGIWVLAEFLLLTLLLTMATIIMYCCRNTAPSIGFLHLIADPVLVTLACIPFLLIRGIPVAHSLETCIYNIENNFTWKSSPIPASCLSSTELLHWNFTSFNHQRFWSYKHELMTLESCLQCLNMAPVILRLLHYKWHVSWQPFIQSCLFLMLEAMDIASLVQITFLLHPYGIRRATEALAYLTSLFLNVACLTIATPPAYLGSEWTTRYLRGLMLTGTCILDLPSMVLKLLLLNQESSRSMTPQFSGLFFLCLLKNASGVVALFVYIIRRLSCSKWQYLSLHRRSSTEAADTQRLYQHDQEDFV